MLSVSLVQLMSLFKGLQDKIGLWLMVALCILALLGSSAYFLVKSLIPPVPESIEIGQADAPSNRGKADYALMQALTARKEPVAWVFAGDSITHGCMHTDYLRNYQEHFTQALKATPERARDTVVNTGVSGATTRELMEYFNAWVADYQADVVFLCFGMNDCATDGITPESYAGNLREAVRRIRAAGAIPVLQTPNTSNRQRKLRPYLEAARALVRQEEILLIDHNAFWSSHPKEVKKLMADGIHPNEYGTCCGFAICCNRWSCAYPKRESLYLAAIMIFHCRRIRTQRGRNFPLTKPKAPCLRRIFRPGSPSFGCISAAGRPLERVSVKTARGPTRSISRRYPAGK